ncbi:MAG: ATP-binding cassette domain-containing protein [Acidobacteria bacterium]|nr:ATP-binding cassette domain-containing protein [Acidobacteriota bacterium]
MSSPLVEVAGVVKNYHALRPLRVAALTVHERDRVALIGFDAAAAELLVNLLTGASLPDAGDIRVFGQRTADIATGDEWLASLDRFGIVSDRGVLLEGATVRQNLAMPFTLEIDPVPADIAARVARLAEECGITTGSDGAAILDRAAAQTESEIRTRMHLARAIALDPRLLILEHPTAHMPRSAHAAFAADFVRVADARGLTAVIITADEAFARHVAPTRLTLNAATGALKKSRWF